ncbi:peptidylprolyl isomerase [Ruminococcus sp.]|uniref:peptidylprolyl isomerase n=1 Tax=Ruminococcus sp. TaxID=41978 RepID=UPI00386F5CB2
MIRTSTIRLLSFVLALMLCFSAVALTACGSKNEQTSSKTEQTTAAQTTQKATEAEVDASALEGTKAVIDVKDYGKITVELYPNYAPKTVANFVKLAESGFYDGLTFHRIMEGFMIQGGDPKGNGTGGSDENIVGEFSANGFTQNTLSHTRGVISMARSSDMNSASSQFFIVHKDSTFLDGQYAAFGEVTDGMDVVDKIATDAKPVDGNGTIPSSKQPVINSVTIERAQ